MQCWLANPDDPTNSTYIVCEHVGNDFLGNDLWRRSDMDCPQNTIFYEEIGNCLDVCWTDETINEMCRAVEQGYLGFLSYEY